MLALLEQEDWSEVWVALQQETPLGPLPVLEADLDRRSQVRILVLPSAGVVDGVLQVLLQLQLTAGVTEVEGLVVAEECLERRPKVSSDECRK